MTTRKPRRTKEETQAVKDEYARLYGPACVELAVKLRKSITWMADEIVEFRNTKAHCDAIAT